MMLSVVAAMPSVVPVVLAVHHHVAPVMSAMPSVMPVMLVVLFLHLLNHCRLGCSSLLRSRSAECHAAGKQYYRHSLFKNILHGETSFLYIFLKTFFFVERLRFIKTAFYYYHNIIEAYLKTAFLHRG